MEAARHGHSMEEEVRIILRNALSLQQTKGLGTRIHERFADSGGLELEMPARSDKPQDAGFEV
ncbi:FitA-like ribbon-helix-helix domain-containing protein [Halomonas sp. V046]|uniref:FitA-like ribbon-helix-helix domain-containing protein n=1 Tax=Halomonas sp. V046 TaxID=3459611 RepID=UPI00404474C5